MTSKLTFRARTLDASKPMAIYNAEDLPGNLRFGSLEKLSQPLNKQNRDSRERAHIAENAKVSTKIVYECRVMPGHQDIAM